MEPSSASASSSELRLDRSDHPDGTTCLLIEGDIDMASSDHFSRTVVHLVEEPTVSRLLLDITGLDFIDSNGVTVLVKGHRAARERGIPFGIINAQDSIRGLLEMLGVYEMLTELRV